MADESGKMKDEKGNVVRRALSAGGSSRRAVEALYDYMHDHDSHVSLAWCEWFVQKVIDEENEDGND